MVKYKSKVPLNSSGKPADNQTEENIPIAHLPTRDERKQQQQKEQEFGNYDDIKPMLRKVGGTLMKQEEIPKPQNVDDKQTFTKDEWSAIREGEKAKVRSVNVKSNTWYSWH